MTEPTLAYDAYDAVDWHLPVTGQRLRVRPFPLSRAIYYLRLLQGVATSNGAVLDFIEQFPQEFGRADVLAALDQLTPMELVRAAWDFFSLARPDLAANGAGPTAPVPATMPAPSPSASTT